MAETSARHLSITSDISIEDARRVVAGYRGDPVKLAQTTHWARYGRAADDFGAARARALTETGGKANIDFERLTLIAEDTLTMERASDLAKLGEDAPATLYDEAMKFSVLSNHFLGKSPTSGQILEFIGKLAKEDVLPSAVRMPKSGKNPLPGALGAWRQKWAENGYDLGFAPKNGVKTLKDADGKVVWSKPWVDAGRLG